MPDTPTGLAQDPLNHKKVLWSGTLTSGWYQIGKNSEPHFATVAWDAPLEYEFPSGTHPQTGDYIEINAHDGVDESPNSDPLTWVRPQYAAPPGYPTQVSLEAMTIPGFAGAEADIPDVRVIVAEVEEGLITDFGLTTYNYTFGTAPLDLDGVHYHYTNDAEGYDDSVDSPTMTWDGAFTNEDSQDDFLLAAMII